MRTLQASEIGAYVYCQRAWWFRRQGIESANAAELAAGSEIHHRHGRSVVATGCLRSIAVALLLTALTLVVLHFTIQVL